MHQESTPTIPAVEPDTTPDLTPTSRRERAVAVAMIRDAHDAVIEAVGELPMPAAADLLRLIYDEMEPGAVKPAGSIAQRLARLAKRHHGQLTGAGLARSEQGEPTPTPALLAAVRQVIDAGRLEYGGGVDVDAIQGEAHTALVRAYQAATGTTVDAERDHRDRLADELVRFADAIRTRRLPAGTFVTLNLGVLAGRADLEQLAGYLGSEIREDGGHGDDIPFTERTIRLDGTQYGPELTVRAQIQPDGRSEVERLRARVAELESQQGGESR